MVDNSTRVFISTGLCSDLTGSPPTVWVDRNWVVDSTAPIGTVVARVRVSDDGNEKIQYELEHSPGFNIIQENEEPLPFTIDDNGKVTTNTSLTNKVLIILFWFYAIYERPASKTDSRLDNFTNYNLSKSFALSKNCN